MVTPSNLKKTQEFTTNLFSFYFFLDIFLFHHFFSTKLQINLISNKKKKKNKE